MPQQRVDRARIQLEQRLGASQVLYGPLSCEPFSRDESEAVGRLPDIVVLARDADDVRATLQIASDTAVPVTPRAGGTGRSGGAVPTQGGIVLATATMNQIKEIHRQDMVVVVEPGVVLADLHDAVEREGLFYPPDPNSLLSCALGGNVAENAGGPRAFKYGVTRDYVLGLDVALMGGQSLRTGRRTVKGVAGYDLTALIVGSEGTLCVTTEITLKLIAKPASVATILALFPSARHAAAAVNETLAQGVTARCMELVDAGGIAAIRSQGLGIDERAGALLLIELDGDELQCDRDLVRTGDACDGAGAVEVLVAQDASQRDRLWAARRELSPALRRMAANKLAEDVVVPRSCMVELIDRVNKLGEMNAVRTVIYGHAGDGNLHVNFLWDHDEQLPRVERAVEAMLREVIALRGTISGEHGIGLMKMKYLGLEQSPALIGLQRQVKQLFDPQGLLNPGKMFDGPGHDSC